MSKGLLRGALGRPTGVVVGLVLAALVPGMVGCYGSFPASKFVYEVNGKATSDRTMHQVVFWLFLIVPVYYVAGIADAAVFNLIEYWSGPTPFRSRATQPGGAEVALTPPQGGDQAGPAAP
jgi:hypothetical protein